MTPSARVELLGDRGVVVRFAARPSQALTGLLAALCTSAREIEGVIDAAPGHRTILVEVDPRRIQEVAMRIPLLIPLVRPIKGRLYKVPIRYDGEDLDWVCHSVKLTRAELEVVHSSKTYDVRMIGSPGFIYLSTVAPKIAVPRREEPRMLVPAGAVGIGGRQTGIYGRARPGGWRIIGTVTGVPKVSPGDRVRFAPD